MSAVLAGEAGGVKAKALETLVALAVVALVAWGCYRLAVTSPQWQERHPTEGTQTCQ